MDSISIRGGARLNGQIPISGAKNAALPLMALSLLTPKPLFLENLPSLADTRFMGELLATLGVEVAYGVNGGGPSSVRLQAPKLVSTFAPYDLVRKMRASFYVLGPLVAREGQAKVSLPGGCAIGTRPVDLHLMALEKLGAAIDLEDGYVLAKSPTGGLTGAEIEFPMVTVGATVTALMTATLASGQTVLKNAAMEPEVSDVADCLNAMGAKISGIGTSELVIEGVAQLGGATHRVLPDRIETGTYAMAVAIAGGEVDLVGARADLIGSVIDVLGEAGVDIKETNEGIRVARNGQRATAADVTTEPFPGFPTDLQAQFMAFMATAEGESTIKETIFENRFMHVPELSRLGADISVDGQAARVTGVERLKGAPVMATDLRASVSLVLAGLAAEGETVVNRVYHLDRGFERIEEKLGACGADITRVSS